MNSSSERPLLPPAELSTQYATAGAPGVDAPRRAPQLLWVRTAPGVSVLHLATFYYAVFMTIAAYTFVNSAQKLVLSVLVGVPDDEIGRATGDLGFYNELMIIALVSVWGVASDKVGRRVVYAAAFVFIALGFYLTSYATSYGVLVVYRLVYAVGASAAAAMLSAVLADYVTFADKGRASGFMGLFSGGGALLAALILLRIPEWLEEAGLAQADAIHGAYLTTASLVLLAGVVVFVLLQGRTSLQEANEHANPLVMLRDGLTAAWRDPQLGLAFLAGFVARGDSVVLITFLSLWVQDYELDNGATETEAAATAGMITGIAQTVALVFSLVAGFIGSRYRGVEPVILVAAIATVGYGAICFVENPTGTAGILCACVIGAGEIGVIVIAQSLASRRAPAKLRGSVGGLVGLCGSVGILVCNKVGGIMYDTVSRTGPFLLFAVFNALLLLSALAVYFFAQRGQPAAGKGAPEEDGEGARYSDDSRDDDPDVLPPSQDEATFNRLLHEGKQREHEATALLRSASES